MELTNYIDADEGRMEAEPAEAAYECFNCGRACDELHHVPEFDYMGCQECLDEAMELLAREAAGKELYPAERQILAAAGLRPCVHCKTKIAAGIRSTAATSSSRRSCVPCVRRWRSGHHSFSDQHPEGTAPAVPRGRTVESQFGGVQHMFSSADGAFYVSDTVGRILAEQFRKLGVRVGEPIEITKAEVANGNGRKSIQWQVARVGFAPGEQPDGTFAVAKPQPPSELQQKLAASIAMVESRTAAAQAQSAGGQREWAQLLLLQTNVLSDVYAAALAHASATHGNTIKPEDIRALLTTAFINLQKGANGRAA